jgi:chemotaxis protein methyltransferase CheR
VDRTNKEFKFTQADYERFRNLILERNGLHFSEDKRQSLKRGLAGALQKSSCANLGEYYELLRCSPSSSSQWEQLVSELTVGETYFFRNKGHFDALTKHILLEIIAQREHSNRRIRIWSAGCATGEEPYSVAMLLHQLIPNLHSWNILILATDINRAALRKAQEGLYGSWSFRGVEKRIQDRYFRLDGHNQFAIAEGIKGMVTFDYLNLVGDCYPSLANNTNAMDLILCRNVTIYFSPEVTQQVVDRFHNCLTDGGWLIPGASEPNMVFYRDFEPWNFPGAVVYQKPAVAKAKVWSVPVFQPLATVVKAPEPEPLPSLPSTSLRAGPDRKKEEKPPPSDPYQVALELLAAGRVDEALVKLYEKLDRDPNFALTYYTLGKIYANKGNLEEAQHWCERAIKKDKLQPEPYYTLSMIYQQHGLLGKAVEALKKTIYLDREFVLAHFSLANIYRQQGNKRLSRKSLQNVQRLLEGKPKAEPVPEGDGLIVGRLLQLVEVELANGKT